MPEGPLAALDAIEKATGEKDVNAVGYCLGGTLLAATLGVHGREEGQADRQRDVHDGADRFHRRGRARGVHRRGAGRVAREAR